MSKASVRPTVELARRVMDYEPASEADYSVFVFIEDVLRPWAEEVLRGATKSVRSTVAAPDPRGPRGDDVGDSSDSA